MQSSEIARNFYIIHKIGLNFDNFKEQYERNWTENNDNNKPLTISKNRLGCKKSHMF